MRTGHDAFVCLIGPVVGLSAAMTESSRLLRENMVRNINEERWYANVVVGIYAV